MENPTARRRAKRSGALTQRKDGRWQFMVDLGRVDGKRKRRAYYGATAEEAEGKARADYPDLRTGDAPSLFRTRHEALVEARKLGSHTRRQWYRKARSLNWLCHYCGKDARWEPGGLIKEHMVPLSRGGSDALDNVVPSCRACNFDKGTRTAEEYLAQRSAA